jgi:hypothetical protein
MIPQLPSHRERNARHNLEAFVTEARTDCAAYGVDLDWDRPDWDITAHVEERRGKAGRRSVLYFTTHENGTAKSMAGRVPLSEPFAAFMKAMVRLSQDGRPQSMDPLSRLINASRDLHDLLADRGHDPVFLLTSDFDQAARLVAKRAEASTSYRLGVALQTIASWVDRRGLSKVTIGWKNPFERVAHETTRMGSENERQAAKLPSDEMLDALPVLARKVKEPSDVIRMALIKLLHCAPWRIGEVLSLRVDCEVEREKMDGDGPVLDADGRRVMRYGISYQMEKSGEFDIKWIPTAMVDVARGAIAEIREATFEARDLARWMECHPGRVRLPEPDLGPDQSYTTADVASMFGMTGAKAGAQWLRGRGIVAGPDRRFDIRRSMLEEVLLLEMAERMPKASDRTWSDYLFIVSNNFYHADRATNTCSLAVTTDQHIGDFLCGRGGEKVEGAKRVASAFERHEVHDAEDLPFRMNTHMFRHWLNTLAQLGGIDQTLIARWSGRKDIGQNAEYDHVSGIKLAEITRKLMADDQMIGHLADLHRQLEPVARDEFRTTVIATAHMTEIGMCLNDWTTSPCPEFGSCAACTECAVKKGDVEAIVRARALRDDTAWMIERTIAEIDDGTADASNHLRGQQDMLAGLDRILAVHEDPAIPDGILVQPNSTSRPHFRGPFLEAAA